MHVSRNRGLVYTLLSAILILLVTYGVIQYATGNFRRTDQGFVAESGLLAANSFPTGAQVLINDKLTSATDDTLNLEPGEYVVKIAKDGYSAWQKSLKIEKGLVTQTNARLFPSATSLTPLTFTGANQMLPSPDGQKILFYTASTSAQKKAGWYVLELSDSTLPLQKGPRQIVTESTQLPVKDAQFIWSPDSDQLLMITPTKEVLLKTDQLQTIAQLPNIAPSRKTLLAGWEQDMYLRERQFLGKFPAEIVTIATNGAKNVYLSPDKEKLLYTATTSAQLSDSLLPALPAANSQTQERKIEPNGIYIYDRKEDRNFRIGTDTTPAITVEPTSKSPSKSLSKNQPTTQPTPLPSISQLSPDKHLLSNTPFAESLLATATSSAYRSLVASSSAQTVNNFKKYHSPVFVNTWQWFPDSTHIFNLNGEAVVIKEYDGTNQTTLFSGQIDNNFIYPWPDGSRLIVATSFSPDSPANLYAVELK